MKVLHITKGGGGLDVYIDLLFKYAGKAHGIEHVVISNRNTSNLEVISREKKIRYLDVRILRQIHPFADFMAFMKIFWILKQENPDVIHVHSSKAGILTKLVCLFNSNRLLYTPHGMAALGKKDRMNLYWIIERVFRDVGIFLFNSPSEREYVIKEFGLKKRSFVYHNPFDILKLSEVVSAMEIPIPYESRKRQILMVGRLVAQKNPLMFVRACLVLCEHFLHLKFKIIGDGLDAFEKTEISKLINESIHKDRFEIVKWLPHKSVAYEMAHSLIVCVPSNFESFGYVAAEAAVLGTPIVATNTIGLRDIVESGQNGYLVEQDDFELMAAKVREIITNRNLFSRLSRNAHINARQKFDVLVNVSKIIEIYRDVGGGDE